MGRFNYRSACIPATFLLAIEDSLIDRSLVMLIIEKEYILVVVHACIFFFGTKRRNKKLRHPLLNEHLNLISILHLSYHENNNNNNNNNNNETD